MGVVVRYLFFAFLVFALVSCAQESEPLNVTDSEYDSAIDRYPSQIQKEALLGSLGAANSNVVPRRISSIGMTLIKHFEGWSSEVYDDPAGYCTVGFGHLIALALCADTDTTKYDGGITRKQGDEILEQDTRLARSAVSRLVTVDLTVDQFSALSSFVFNVGSNNFANSTLLRRVNAQRHDLAEREFGRWVYSGGEKFTGLEIRRACERSLFTGTLSLDKDGNFDRSKCGGLGVADSVGEPIDIQIGEE